MEVRTTVVTRRNDDGSASPAGAGIVPIRVAFTAYPESAQPESVVSVSATYCLKYCESFSRRFCGAVVV